eukprot:SAG31_NODE_10928_length_1082_cov_1.326551_1_plen_46_part_10
MMRNGNNQHHGLGNKTKLIAQRENVFTRSVWPLHEHGSSLCTETVP